jgi:hypothetical protein
MSELGEHDVVDELLLVVPELLPICEEARREYGFDYRRASHGTFMTEVLPELRRWLALPEAGDRLRRLFAYIERMAVDGDSRVRDIVRCTIVPDLLSLAIVEPARYATARSFMGSSTVVRVERFGYADQIRCVGSRPLQRLLRSLLQFQDGFPGATDDHLRRRPDPQTLAKAEDIATELDRLLASGQLNDSDRRVASGLRLRLREVVLPIDASQSDANGDVVADLARTFAWLEEDFRRQELAWGFARTPHGAFIVSVLPRVDEMLRADPDGEDLRAIFDFVERMVVAGDVTARGVVRRTILPSFRALAFEDPSAYARARRRMGPRTAALFEELVSSGSV